MTYALLVYDVLGSWHGLSAEEKRVLHAEYQAVAASHGVIGHFRIRPSQTTTTVRVEEGQLVKSEGPIADGRESLRALYLVESDEHDAVLELAARIPAARRGGAVEVWMLAQG